MPIVYSETLNQGRFETWTEKPIMDFHHVTQIHGIDIVWKETLPAEADGIVSSWEELKVPLAIKTADCLPIVIEGEKGIVFLHAGWRGLANDSLHRPEISLILPQRAFIGPSIHNCCFEVSTDFKDNFKGSPNFTERDQKLFFNLQQEALLRLRNKFPNLLVTIAPICTCCHNNFYSYRRDKTTQRNWNLYIKG
jgi:copper oxidase (laccase) domain-containing protein